MKKRIIFGLGALIAGAASAFAIKKMMDNDYKPVSKANDEENDRGVAPVRTEKNLDEENSDDDEVQNVKADAINHGYKPIKY